MVPKRGLEPPRPDGHYTLNVARLPIPPLRPRNRNAAPSRCRSRVTWYDLAISGAGCQEADNVIEDADFGKRRSPTKLGSNPGHNKCVAILGLFRPLYVPAWVLRPEGSKSGRRSRVERISDAIHLDGFSGCPSAQSALSDADHVDRGRVEDRSIGRRFVLSVVHPVWLSLPLRLHARSRRLRQPPAQIESGPLASSG